MLAAADWLLTVLHVAVVLAFVLLWIPEATWRWHGRLVAVVAFSWIAIGLYKGALGYCFLTDLHWRVKRARGVRHLPGSFLKYMADHVTGTDVSPKLIDTVAATVFAFVCAVALVRAFNARRRTLR